MLLLVVVVVATVVIHVAVFPVDIIAKFYLLRGTIVNRTNCFC